MSITHLENKSEKLSNEQVNFIKKVESISILRAELFRLKNEIPLAIQKYFTHTQSLNFELRKIKILKIKAIDLFFLQTKVSKNDMQLISSCIQVLVDSLELEEQEIDQELKSIIDRYPIKNLEIYNQMKAEFLNETLELIFKDKFGNDAEFNPNKTFEENAEHFQSQKNAKPDYDFENKQDIKKNTRAKQIKELKEKQKNELKHKSLREIYLNLIKNFHPDTEMNVALKLEKEEICKQITIAYDKKDLIELLNLEKKHSEHNQNTSSNKIKLYLEMLEEQRKKLDNELWVLKTENEFIYKNMCSKNSNPTNFLKKVKYQLQSELESIKFQVQILQGEDKKIKNRKEVCLQIVNYTILKLNKIE